MFWSFACSKISLINLMFLPTYPLRTYTLPILFDPSKQWIIGTFLIFLQLFWPKYCNLNLLMLLGVS